MKAADMNPLVRAALLWDTPTLTSSGSVGAAAFRDVMSARPLRGADKAEDLIVEGDPPVLMSCASALETYFKGHEEEAIGRLRLQEMTGQGPDRLLPLMLLLWLDPTRPDEWERARDLIDRLDDEPFKAHMYAKLFVFAYDSGNETARTYLEEARSHAGVALGAQLDIVSFNLYGTEYSFTNVYEGDDLVDLPWLDHSATEATSKLLVELAKSDVEPPWSSAFHTGLTPVTHLATVENQATWAGAIWRRNRYRAAYAASLILTGTRNPIEAQEAVSFWVATGGADIPSVVERLESSFRPDTADRILSEDLISEAKTRVGRTHYVNAALALWDLISEPTIEMLFETLTPTESSHPTEDRIRRLWSLLALRNPTRWLRRFQQLDHEIQRMISSHFTRSAVPKLGEALEPAVNALLPASSSDLAFVAAGLLHLGREVEVDSSVAVTAGASVILDVIDVRDDLLPAEVIDSVVLRLTERCESDLGRARTGSYSFGGEDPRASLGSLARFASSTKRDDAIEVLVASAMTEEVPRSFRLGGLQGLLALALAGLLEQSTIRIVSYAPIGSENDPIYSVEADLIRAVQASLRALWEIEAAVPELLLLVRSPDSNARRVAVNALSRTVRAHESSAALAAIMGALYDPDPYVISRVLVDLPVEELMTSDWRSALIDRLLSLLASGRRVRLALTHPVKEIVRLSGTDDAQIDHLVKRLKSDRSWEISQQAQEIS